MKRYLRVLQSKFFVISGLDFHVLTTLAYRVWGIVAGAVTIILLPNFLTPEEQGYYFAFSSILAIQVFFELGLGGVIITIVSHESANLKISDDGALTDDDARWRRLAALSEFTYRWYRFAASVFFVAVSGVGLSFFLLSEGWLNAVDWAPAFLVSMLFTSINLFFSPRLAITEGLGSVGEVARVRLTQSVIGYILLWIILSVGLGMWAVSAVPVAAAFYTFTWLRKNNKWRFQLKHKSSSQNSPIFSWRHDVFPLQWRIAVSWLSGYFLFNLFVPVTFSSEGPVEAGKLGLALTIFNGINTVGMSWAIAKAPAYAAHIARGEDEQLRKLFRSVTGRVFTATSFFAALVTILAYAASGSEVQFMDRVSSPFVFLCMSLGSAANSIVASCAVYMRAHRKEPMLTPSVVGAIITTIAIWLTRGHGVEGMMLANTLLTVFMGLPWTLLVLRKYYRYHTLRSN